MRKVPVRFVLPTFLAALLLILLAVMGHTTQSPLKIIIYTDFECGACGKLHLEVEPELRERYVVTGKAQIETRLLGAMSPDSIRAAGAALCAGDQGRFLEYQDALFRAWREQEEDYAVFSVEALINLAAVLGLDEAAFTTCLNSNANKTEVEENMDMAQADGVRTLPAFLVGNITIQGYKPLDTYIEAIEEALEAQSA
jgi:protein-disulfide isomerase